MTSSEYSHFYNRAGFGVTASTHQLKQTTLQELLKNGSHNKPIQLISKPELEYDDRQSLEMKRKEILKNQKEDQLRLNKAWFMQLTDPTAVFREKMTFFWHDHFACRIRMPFLAQKQNNTLREFALGKFGDLLMAISKDPGMLQFLNNQQNKKGSPNENFAREVMELFTLGQGNYTEQDIKNAARAFTGWAFNQLTGEFQFRPKQHDFGSKDFRGKSGSFSGEDILAMILDDKQCARFITTKVCDFFAGSSIDPSIIQELADSFYKSDYDLGQLVTSIYSSKWFYEKKFIGNRIKSPVELIAGIQVHTAGGFSNPQNIIYLQKALGQILFQPPNVGGWPAGKGWIDSSSLTFRMSMPSILLRNSETELQAKDDGDANDATNEVVKPGKLSFSVDWEKLATIFSQSSSEQTLESIENYLLVTPTTDLNRKKLTLYANEASSDLELVKRGFIGFMSLPEYQLS